MNHLLMRKKSFLLLLACLLFSNTSVASADKIDLQVAVGKPFMLADQKQTIPLKVGLTGFVPSKQEERPSVNVAIVLDRSGSMAGEKLKKAKEAAIMAVERLGANDIVSVISYDHTTSVIVPATKLTDKEHVIQLIKQIHPRGTTALFAGVGRGAKEVHKFLDRNRVNRIVLLSDGLANVGPSSPGALGELGESLNRDGISVTTIGLGLGYNEDLMTALAEESDGNHAFAENANDLARIYKNEFGDILSVVAQDVEIKVRCSEGIRPVRVLGRKAEIYGTTVIASVNQVYSGQEKYVLLEVEVPATADGSNLKVADVNVSYANMQTRDIDRLSKSAMVSFTSSEKVVRDNRDIDTLTAYYSQLANERNAYAMALRDAGKTNEAKKALEEAIDILGVDDEVLRQATAYKQTETYKEQARRLETDNWESLRKSMANDQFRYEHQQMW